MNAVHLPFLASFPDSLVHSSEEARIGLEDGRIGESVFGRWNILNHRVEKPQQ